MTRYLILLLVPLGIASIGFGIDDSSAAVFGYGAPTIFDVGIDSCSLPDTIGYGERVLVWVRNYSSFPVDIPVSMKVYDITIDTILFIDITEQLYQFLQTKENV